MFALICFSCEYKMGADNVAPDSEEQTENDEFIENDVPAPIYPANIQLKGTKWKLEGVVNIKTGEMITLQPDDCDSCYTLTFHSDSVAEVKAITIYTKLDLGILNPTIWWEDILILEKYDKDGKWYNATPFRLSVAIIKSYSVSANELKIYHNIYYFFHSYTLLYSLFKPIEI